MKKLLIQLDSDPHPSSFDGVVAYDADVDELLSYGGVRPGDTEGLVHGAIFTRGPKDLKNTAVFIGGRDLSVGEEILAAAREAFFGPLRVSLMLDSNGSNTTAVAAVIKLQRAVGDIAGKNVVIVAGTGPVGMRSAMLFAGAGARVTITSRDEETAERARAVIEERSDSSIAARTVSYPLGPGDLLDEADVVLASGPPGIQLVQRAAWSEDNRPSVLGDVNAVPPLGVEGVEADDDGETRDGAITFGALGIGNFKMKLHKACIRQLFESNDKVLDAEAIYKVGQSL